MKYIGIFFDANKSGQAELLESIKMILDINPETTSTILHNQPSIEECEALGIDAQFTKDFEQLLSGRPTQSMFNMDNPLSKIDEIVTILKKGNGKAYIMGETNVLAESDFLNTLLDSCAHRGVKLTSLN